MRVLSLLRASGAVALTLSCAATEDSNARSHTGGDTEGTTGTSGTSGTSGGETGGGATSGGGPVDRCHVGQGDDDPVPVCTEKAPADAFAPVVKWSWHGPAVAEWTRFGGSWVTPLVGHFVDTNGDGSIDLCDTPSVLALAQTSPDMGSGGVAGAHLFLLAGDSGAVQLELQIDLNAFVTPAFGDIDGDGLPEIVAADRQGHLVALAHDGGIEWVSEAPVPGLVADRFLGSACAALAIYDLEGDGRPEILAATDVFDSQGSHLFGVPGSWAEYFMAICATPTAADLDDDGRLEVIFGREVYRADGTLLWSTDGEPGHPHVADFDGDGSPEVLIAGGGFQGLAGYDAQGQPLWAPWPSEPCNGGWGPGSIQDVDGDGTLDFFGASCQQAGAYRLGSSGPEPLWSQAIPMQDLAGDPAGTSFDFLGRGVPHAVYADDWVYAFDGQTGAVSLKTQARFGTVIEYPVVADVDNDRSADIVVAATGEGADAITVYQDAEQRWIPARRIWNQHAYHVTNVREDGTIPAPMAKHWTKLNTFRNNAQVDDSGACDPPEPK